MLKNLLIGICLASAIAVIWVRHENRVQIIELQDIYEQRDSLNIEWQKLKIELAAMGRHDQLANSAGAGLGMSPAQEHSVIFLNPQAQSVDD
ncbi:MAG: cell division protein FtsL [Acidiferrobacterales bacterium]|nr:cell division protein FtsL [Acidiferrobacterales bacterium]